jgi:seryl-tRNA synthetase
MVAFYRQFNFIKQNLSFNLRYFSSLRPPSNNLSLNSNLISTNYELVKTHLIARRCNEDIINKLDKVIELRLKRNSLIVQSDVAKNMRKSISMQIGKLMKEDKNNSNINDLKLQVEEFNHHSSKANEELRIVDEELKDILSIIPNLLDDRSILLFI